MPKAIISNKIYLDTTPELLKELVSKLTYKIKKPPRPGMTHFSMFEVVKNYKLLPKGVLSMPVGRTDLIPKDYEIVDKRILHELPFPNPAFGLRPGQQVVYDQVTDSCFINAMVGWGKTFTALHIARKLGQKTLIVCHNTMIRDHWIKEVEILYNMPVGIIGSGKFDIDHSIVVGNIQTLSKELAKISKEFGCVIIDEAHHCPASTFTDFIDGMYARYKIGLSGTMQRKDGKHILFKDFFGFKIYQPPVEGTLVPEVLLVNTGIALSPGDPWAVKVNKLLYDPDYQFLVASIAQMQLVKGHKVLIIADRVEFLQNVKELIGESCVCITGGTSFEEREKLKEQVESGEKDSIAGSRQIFSEGISVNPLSCVILAGPIAAPAGGDGLLEQIVGRIMRQYPDKLTPLVVDLQFAGPADRKQNKDRIGFYMRKGWKIEGLK